MDKQNGKVSRWKLLIFLLFGIFCGTQAQIEYVQGDDRVSLKPSPGSAYTLTMDETTEKTTVLVKGTNYDGSTEIKIEIITGLQFNYKIDKDLNLFSFILDQDIDYEKISSKISQFSINVGDDITYFQLEILNIDDTSPILISAQCTFNETEHYNVENSTCELGVTDEDGFMNTMIFSIDKDDNTFDIVPSKEYTKDDKEGIFKVITTESAILDFETIMMYNLKVTVTDSGENKNSGNLIITITDMPDQPPRWTKIVTSKQIEEEKEDKTLQVTAVDGDTNIQDKIKYSISDFGSKYEFKIDENGFITIPKIDRDVDGENLPNSFKVQACDAVSNLDDDCTENTEISLFIIDIDDNIPKISVISNAEPEPQCRPTKTFKNISTIIESHSIDFKICEELSGILPLTISIEDIDDGANAQFSVSLEGNLKDLFQIIPNAGYKKGDFQINILDPSKLNYDSPESISNLTIQIVSVGLKNPNNKDTFSLNIELVPYNDETPKFTQPSYKAHIKETAKTGDLVTIVEATDADNDDHIKYILDSDFFSIDDEGKVTVKKDNPFDYDITKSVTVQIKAVDKVDHYDSATLEITVDDVNNKPPTIATSGVITVEENQQNNFVLQDATITISDPDSTAELEWTILWDETTARKNSIPVKNDKIKNWLKLVEETDPKSTSKKLNLVIDCQDPCEDTPDYELFDILYLKLEVTDIKTDEEFIKIADKTTQIIAISIDDVNDNPPRFTDDTRKSNFQIKENAEANEVVGNLVATDADINDSQTYTIECSDENDWIQVDATSGKLTVKEGVKVDADNPPVYNISYIAKVTDLENQIDTFNMIVYVVDTNNKDFTTHYDQPVKVLENAVNTHIVNIEYEDADRDAPNNIVKCTLDDSKEQCFKYIQIDRNTNEISTNSKPIDRDGEDGITSISCSFLCKDNPDDTSGTANQHQRTVDMTIIIEDENDNIPEIVSEPLVVSESLKKNDILGVLKATDPDEAENAHAKFVLKKIEPLDQKATLDLTYFEDIKEEFNGEHETKFNLVLKKDLRGTYGEYLLHFDVSDVNNPNPKEQTVNLQVTKYNFDGIKFVNQNDGDIFVLKPDQSPNQNLVTYNDTILDSVVVSTSDSEEGCSEKFKFEITLEDSSGMINKHDINECSSDLRVTSKYIPKPDEDISYKITLKTKIKNQDHIPEEGEKPYEASITVTLRFFDVQDPVFSGDLELSESLRESDDSLGFPLKEKASYTVGIDKPIYYLYYSKDEADDGKDYFNVNLLSGEVTLKKALDYETKQMFKFQIAASNNEEYATSKKPNSFLDVTVSVLNINDNDPEFETDKSIGAIVVGDKTNKPIIDLKAIDPDGLTERLTYGLVEDSLSCSELNVQNPFTIQASAQDANYATVYLNFAVDKSMKGSCTFQVFAIDDKDEFDNPPRKGTTTVEIVVITEENSVLFKFENSIQTVKNLKEEIKKRISIALNLTCNEVSIDDNSKENELETLATFFFTKESEIVIKDDVYKILFDPQTYANLKNSLMEISILLENFDANDDEPENYDKIVKIALIAISVVLACLCLFLLIMFVIKVRSLNNTISKLTMADFGFEEPALKQQRAAPNTNIHAEAGANPMFEKQMEIHRDIDRESVSSGDSNMIGIEDSPDFDMERNSDIGVTFDNNSIREKLDFGEENDSGL